MFNSPTTSCKTVKGSLQTPASIKKYQSNDNKNSGCRHLLSTEHLMFKTVRVGKEKFKQQKKCLTQPIQKSVLVRTYNQRTIEFRKCCLHLKTE